VSKNRYPQERPVVKEPPKVGTYEHLEQELRAYQAIQIEAHSKKVLNRNHELYEKLIISYAVHYRRVFAPQISESSLSKLVVSILLELDE